MNNSQSSFFDFNKTTAGNINLRDYTGWNGLVISKIYLKKGECVTNKEINEKYSNLENKEKIFVSIEGMQNLILKFSKKFLKPFDAVNFFKGKNDEYKIEAIDNSILYMISAKNLENLDQNKEPFFFNFKNDLETKNLWGGKIISRVYESLGLTLVLFELKDGFKFEDKGHHNEQITWLIDGSMDFFTDGITKTLNDNNIGVDIKSNHLHGGICKNKAIGFDAFFPKRDENKYKN